MIRQRTSHLDPIMEPLAQPFRSVFETKHGETVTEAKQRRMAEAREDCRNIKSLGLPKGSPGKNRQENATQDAKWLYRQLLCGDTPTEIVSAYHNARKKSHGQELSDGCGCWQRVSRGLLNAMSLLNATPFEFAADK